MWIAVDPNGHIQAVGIDDAGRRQYLYHPRWRERRDRGKFARALELAEALPHARGRVTTALRRDDLDRERVLAASFRLLDEAAPRIGSARYLERHGSRGLTTLQRRDASVEASVITLSFPGKSGKRAYIEVDDDELAAVVGGPRRGGRPRSPLLSYRQGQAARAAHSRRRQRPCALADRRRVHREGLPDAARHDPRRGGAGPDRNGRHRRSERKRAEVLAVRATADALGNTPAVARASYIDPAVFSAYERGKAARRSTSRPSPRSERLLASADADRVHARPCRAPYRVRLSAARSRWPLSSWSWRAA